MYTNDPHDIPRPRAPQPETPDHIKAFWSQVPDMRPTTPTRDRGLATTNVCRFDSANRRVLHVRGGCVHFEDVRRGPTP